MSNMRKESRSVVENRSPPTELQRHTLECSRMNTSQCLCPYDRSKNFQQAWRIGTYGKTKADDEKQLDNQSTPPSKKSIYYGGLLGPTTDESILAGLQTVIDMCSIVDIGRNTSQSTVGDVAVHSSTDTIVNENFAAVSPICQTDLLAILKELPETTDTAQNTTITTTTPRSQQTEDLSTIIESPPKTSSGSRSIISTFAQTSLRNYSNKSTQFTVAFMTSTTDSASSTLCPNTTETDSYNTTTSGSMISTPADHEVMLIRNESTGFLTSNDQPINIVKTSSAMSIQTEKPECICISRKLPSAGKSPIKFPENSSEMKMQQTHQPECLCVSRKRPSLEKEAQTDLKYETKLSQTLTCAFEKEQSADNSRFSTEFTQTEEKMLLSHSYASNKSEPPDHCSQVISKTIEEVDNVSQPPITLVNIKFMELSNKCCQTSNSAPQTLLENTTPTSKHTIFTQTSNIGQSTSQEVHTHQVFERDTTALDNLLRELQAGNFTCLPEKANENAGTIPSKISPEFGSSISYTCGKCKLNIYDPASTSNPPVCYSKPPKYASPPLKTEEPGMVSGNSTLLNYPLRACPLTCLGGSLCDLNSDPILIQPNPDQKLEIVASCKDIVENSLLSTSVARIDEKDAEILMHVVDPRPSVTKFETTKIWLNDECNPVLNKTPKPAGDVSRDSIDNSKLVEMCYKNDCPTRLIPEKRYLKPVAPVQEDGVSQRRTRSKSSDIKQLPSDRKRKKKISCAEDTTTSSGILSEQQPTVERKRRSKSLSQDDQTPHNQLVPNEIRFAVARITKFDEFSTFEILKSSSVKPKVVPKPIENVFVIKNKKISK